MKQCLEGIEDQCGASPTSAAAVLDCHGLVPALEFLATPYPRDGVFHRGKGPAPRALASNRGDPIYRVSQEALTNVSKHARAVHVVISSSTAGGAALHDCGRCVGSMPAWCRSWETGTGLAGIRDRLKGREARWKINSAPEGTAGHESRWNQLVTMRVVLADDHQMVRQDPSAPRTGRDRGRREASNGSMPFV